MVRLAAMGVFVGMLVAGGTVGLAQTGGGVGGLGGDAGGGGGGGDGRLRGTAGLDGLLGAPPTTTRPVSRFDTGLTGRNVEQVRVLGNAATSASLILNAVRTREGKPFDPQTVEEDYQRIYNLRKFANVEAKVEPTVTGGVVVVFIVTEQKTISSLAFLGNVSVATPTIRDVVDLREGESIDRFRIALAKQAIERLYRDKNYPFASVDIDEQRLTSSGELVFNIVEGPNVRIRKINFPGNQSFDKEKLVDQIRSRSWIFIFQNGRLDFDQLEDDVAALRRFYEERGFFDVRVGRRVMFSANLTECNVDFVISEGKRYVVDKVTFQGLSAVTEEKLRQDIKIKEGEFYDVELVRRDIREFVKAFSPFGYIYQEVGAGDPSYNPEYLHIEPRLVYRREQGKVELVYQVSEGKPFRMGRVIVKGNPQSQDKLVLREMRVQPGQLYNSAELTDAAERIQNSPYFSRATITPIGDDPNYRDVLVQVEERQFRSFNIGAGINSNGGIGGNITFDHRNFDITQVPDSPDELLTDRAFTGAGQRLRISAEPGTEFSSASVLFTEPYLFDSPFSLTSEAYFRQRIRPNWRETRLGGRVTFGRRLDYENSVSFTVRAEDVEVGSIDEPVLRAPQVLALAGHSTLTTYGLAFTRDTTNRGFIPYKGYTFRISSEQAAPPGDYTYNKVVVSADNYYTLYNDLTDRKVILALKSETGYIFGGSAPFFEQFYGGGLGSIRGFRFRGISPRAGLDDDPIGGKFSIASTVELSYPLAGNFLRGVVFIDSGTVNNQLRVGTFRAAAGAGVRIFLPFLGQAPFALDFATPLAKDDLDETEVISFSFGFNP